jgi:hypothetical protein
MEHVTLKFKMGSTCKVRHQVLHSQIEYTHLAGLTCQVQTNLIKMQTQMMHFTGLPFVGFAYCFFSTPPA